jgi:Bacterial extracellular solute-binding protein
MSSSLRGGDWRRLLTVSSAALLVVAGCGSSATPAPATSAASQAAGASQAAAASPYTDPNAKDSGGAITVWVDAPRVPATDAFKKAHPEIQMTVNTISGNVGSTDLQQQFVLFNQAASGWPDAIFFPSNDDIAWATSSKINYARDLSTLLPDFLKGYSAAANGPCNIDNQVRCVRNDEAQDVFWYNATLFKQWGYTPPKTWEDYATLGVKIATDHPGYISGFLGDAYAPDRYLWASGCPTNDRLSETSVHINLADPNCTRVKSMIDTMIAGKALTSVGIFDPNAAQVGPKLVMSPGAVWWGNYLFRDTWKIPAGQMTATTPLKWTSDSQGYTGDEGGGLWGVSSHITGKELANTLIFAQFVAADPAWQVQLSTGMPAYGPVQQAWLDKQASAAYFSDTAASGTAFKAAGDMVRGNHYYMLYNTGGIWSKTVTPVLTGGQNLSAAWDAFNTELLNEAQTFGYKVQATGN